MHISEHEQHIVVKMWTTKSNTNGVSNIVSIAEDKNEKASEIGDITAIPITPKINLTSGGRGATTDSVIIYATKHMNSGADVDVNNNVFPSITLSNRNRGEALLRYDGITSSTSKYVVHVKL